MADQINGYINREAFKADTDFGISQIDLLLAKFTSAESTKIDLSKSLGGRAVAANIKAVNEELQKNIDLTNNATKASAANAKAGKDAADAQVSAFQKLKNEFKATDDEAKNLATTYGVYSDQAQKAAEKAAALREQIAQINALSKNGPAPVAAPIESVTNLPDISAIEATGEAVTQLEKDEAQATIEAIEWGNAQRNAAAAGADVTKAAKETGAAIEEQSGYFSDVLGSINSNVEAYEENAAALAANKVEQKALASEIKAAGGATDAQRKKAADLKIQYNDLNNVQKDLKKTIENQIKAETSEAGSLTQLRSKLALVTNEYEKLGAAAKNTALGQKLKAEIDTLSPVVNKAEQDIGKFGRNVGNYANAITGVFSKAFAGLRTLANIIPGLGIGGIFLGIFEGIKYVYQALNDLNSEAVKVSSFIEKVDGGYIEASANIRRLTEDISLAKKGFGDKKTVLDDYNKSFGETLGYTNDLAVAEQNLIELGPSYIKYLFNKAVAQEAYSEAAKKAVDAEKEAAKDFKDVSQTGVGKFLNAADYELSVSKIKFYLNRGVIDQEEYNARLKKLDSERDSTLKAQQQRNIGNLKSDADQLTAIGDKYEEIAQKIADGVNLTTHNKPKADKSGEDTATFFDKELKDQQAALEQLSKEDNIYLLSRVAAREEAYLKETEILNGHYAAEIANAKGNSKKKLEVDQNYNYEREKSALKLQTDLLKIVSTSAAGQQQLEKQINDQFIAEQDKAAKDKAAAMKAEYDKRINYESESRDILLAANEKALTDGLISQEDYEKKKKEIIQRFSADILKIQIEYAEAMVEAQKAAGLDVAAQEAQLAALKLKYNQLANDDINKQNKDALAKEKDYVKKREDLYKQLANELINVFQAIGDAQFENQKNALQDQIDLVDRKREKEIEAANASVATDQQKADQVALINARADAQKTVLEQKQRQTDQRKAQFDKQIAEAKIIASTAQAVIAVLAQYPGPQGYALAAITAAIGAAQLAVVAATPIPRYKDGTNDHPGGLAYMGDGGRQEVAVLPDGSLYVSPPTETLVPLPKHTQVIPSVDKFNETMVKMNHRPVADSVHNSMMDAMMKQQAASLKKLERGVVNAINSQPRPIIKNTFRGVQWGYQSASNYREYINRNMP